MTVPEAARYAAAFAGLVLVCASMVSVIGTVITPRPATGRLGRGLDHAVDLAFNTAIRPIKDYLRRDRILAAQAPAFLIVQLATWLLLFYLGYSLLLWPVVDGGISTAFVDAGAAFWAFGEVTEHGAAERAILYLAALTGLITVALQISYLPALYSAFGRRQTEVALLNARAGLPAWGPELLARMHYGLGSGVSRLDTLPELYATWEHWAADVMETHTTYPPLVRIRSPHPLASWVTALLAVLDSAAILLSVSPSLAPTVPARMCLRSGFLCLQEIALTVGLVTDEQMAPGEISLRYEEFLEGIGHMAAVDFAVERTPEEAWPDFVGWRINYEPAAYAIARAIYAPPALWSGPRRVSVSPMVPIRPPL